MWDLSLECDRGFIDVRGRVYAVLHYKQFIRLD